MTDSIKDLLAKRDFEQPDEIQHIKDFIKSKFDEDAAVKITQNSIIISVNNASLAGALRIHLHTLSKELATEKKLLIRIV